MYGCKDGRIEEWKDGRMVGWKSGRMERGILQKCNEIENERWMDQYFIVVIKQIILLEFH